jgi:hypothetical protein
LFFVKSIEQTGEETSTEALRSAEKLSFMKQCKKSFIAALTLLATTVLTKGSLAATTDPAVEANGVIRVIPVVDRATRGNVFWRQSVNLHQLGLNFRQADIENTFGV